MDDLTTTIIVDRMTFQPKEMRSGDRIVISMSGPHDREAIAGLNLLFGGPVKVTLTVPTTEELDELAGQTELGLDAVDE